MRDFGSGWQLVGAIIALAAVTMATLQLLVDLTPIRVEFYRKWLVDWFEGRAKIANSRSQTKGGKPVDAQEALRSLVSFATGGQARTLFSLPVDQLVAQISAAAQMAIEYPKDNLSLLTILSQPVAPQLANIFSRAPSQGPSPSPTSAPPPPPPSQPGGDADSVADDIETLLYKPAPVKSASEGSEYLEARNRIAHRIQRNLDAIQIALTNDTQLRMQLIALATAIVITFIYSSVRDQDDSFLSRLLIGVAAGYAAPLFGDLVVAIRRIGQR